ncbi:MAG TPA: hypothetical protein VFL30_00390, partial [Rhodanobacteraceae bacterium]|nr:hypothetical protein [Rhodanobacteraceae bacterium]
MDIPISDELARTFRPIGTGRALRREAGIRHLRRDETHDRLDPTLAKRSARGFQETGIFSSSC